MIIKLQGADFSANNIGIIDLRTAPDTQTANLLALYGKTWSLAKQLAINDFLLGIQSATYYSKIDKLLLPILAPAAPINLTLTAANHMAFYDIKNSVYVQIKANGGGNTYHQIASNGLSATTAANGNAYGLVMNNFCAGRDKNNIHLGVYYNTNNLTDVVGGNLYTLCALQDQVSLGYSTGAANAIYDTNTKINKGLRIASFTPTLITGLSNDLPLSSTIVNASNNSDFTTNPNFNILSKTSSSDNIKLNTEVGLITLGTALTQIETASYNQLIKNLMNSLWV